MNNRLSKSIKRLEKLNLIKSKDKVEKHRDLSAYEVKVFRQLRDKYDLSVEKNEISSNQKNETELTNNAKITLERIKKGEKISHLRYYFLVFFFPVKSFSNYVLLDSYSFSNLLLQLATNKGDKEKGLMNIDRLIDFNGMFLYKKPKVINMWMHNTRIPLDIIFIDKLVK